jgi:hypothetical protein
MISPPVIRAAANKAFSFSISPSPPIRQIHSMKSLTVDSLNPAIRNVQYAVRGELAIRAEEYRVKLKQEGNGLPFTKVISSNIGNPQQKGLDQPPITFTRQVRPTPYMLSMDIVHLAGA